MANAANAKLHRKVGNQKELLTRQSAEIRELTYQLDEMRRMQQQEVQQEAKKVSSSEKRAAALHRKLGDMSHEHEMAMSAAAASMRELQKERDAMAMALAAIATQAVSAHCPRHPAPSVCAVQTMYSPHAN
jgi:predicted RNase H-like nuclease (RuvC/YqgF family)